MDESTTAPETPVAPQPVRATSVRESSPGIDFYRHAFRTDQGLAAIFGSVAGSSKRRPRVVAVHDLDPEHGETTQVVVGEAEAILEPEAPVPPDSVQELANEDVVEDGVVEDGVVDEDVIEDDVNLDSDDEEDSIEDPSQGDTASPQEESSDVEALLAEIESLEASLATLDQDDEALEIPSDLLIDDSGFDADDQSIPPPERDTEPPVGQPPASDITEDPIPSVDPGAEEPPIGDFDSEVLDEKTVVVEVEVETIPPIEETTDGGEAGAIPEPDEEESEEIAAEPGDAIDLDWLDDPDIFDGDIGFIPNSKEPVKAPDREAVSELLAETLDETSGMDEEVILEALTSLLEQSLQSAKDRQGLDEPPGDILVADADSDIVSLVEFKDAD